MARAAPLAVIPPQLLPLKSLDPKAFNKFDTSQSPPASPDVASSESSEPSVAGIEASEDAPEEASAPPFCKTEANLFN